MELLLVCFLAGLGAVLGSFLGVVAERVNTGQSWQTGRSKCNSCARPLDGFDLVPILSYLTTGGRCRTCRSRVPATYLFVEASLALAFVLSYFALGLSFELPVFLIALVLIAFIVLYDLRHTIVPTWASNVLMILALFYAYLTAPSLSLFGLALFVSGIIGLAFFLMYALSGGRAMGLGDAPVALSLSLLVGSYALGGLLLSFWIGALCGVLILVLRRGGPRMGIEVPFVPFLAIGYLAAFFIQWNPLPFLW